MKDIGAAFDAWFSLNGEKTSASVGARGADVGKYCLWAMNRKGGEPPIALTAEEEPRVQKWIERADALVDEAQRLAVAGEARDGVAFDSLKQRSLTLADEFFWLLETMRKVA